MKKFFIPAIFLCFCLNLSAQMVTVTFTAKFEGVRVQLDSIYIQNLTQPGSKTLYYPDTVLVLGPSSVASHSSPNEFHVSPNVPNPFTGETVFDVYLEREEELSLKVFSLTGHELTHFHGKMPAGKHSFTFFPGAENVYVLMAETKTHRTFMKMICVEAHGASWRLEHTSYATAGYSNRATDDFFVWDMGDNLRFTGFSTLDSVTVGTQSIENDPIFDLTLSFFIFRGISCVEEPYVTDPDGNVYRTVKIGSQCWMAENLKASKYSDFSSIPTVADYNAWSALTTPAHYWFNDGDYTGDSAMYVEIYGMLYNWYAVNTTTNGNKNICPPGWHVPSHTEWLTLVNSLGGTAVAGGKLKERSFFYWNNPNTGATNQTGFSAISAGFRNPDGNFTDYIGTNGHWWSTSEYSATNGLFMGLGHATGSALISNMNKKSGFAVRCVKD
jgi:uncharacterized protein (TIGR02145 family)